MSEVLQSGFGPFGDIDADATVQKAEKCLVGWITDIIETLFIRVDVSELEKQRVKFKSVATRSSFDGGGGGGHTLVLTEQRAVEDLIGAPKRNRHGLSHRLV